MKVKIVKCSDRENSYSHLVGKVFEVNNSNHMLCVIVDGNCVYNISSKDTIPVSEIRYEIKASKKIIKSCITSCEHIRDTSVGSWACEECEHNCGIDKVNQTVLCSWQDLEVGDTVVIEGFKGMKKSYVKEESKEMKRLDIRKDYMDNNISTSRHVSISNSKEYIRVQVGEDLHFRLNGDVTLDQANAILKVMGLGYELYESTNWSKVEEGAEVTWIEECIVYKAPNGVLRRLGEFVKYIPDIKKIVVRVGDEVKVVDEDKVELC